VAPFSRLKGTKRGSRNYLSDRVVLSSRDGFRSTFQRSQVESFGVTYSSANAGSVRDADSFLPLALSIRPSMSRSDSEIRNYFIRGCFTRPLSSALRDHSLSLFLSLSLSLPPFFLSCQSRFLSSRVMMARPCNSRGF